MVSFAQTFLQVGKWLFHEDSSEVCFPVFQGLIINTSRHHGASVGEPPASRRRWASVVFICSIMQLYNPYEWPNINGQLGWNFILLFGVVSPVITGFWPTIISGAITGPLLITIVTSSAHLVCLKPGWFGSNKKTSRSPTRAPGGDFHGVDFFFCFGGSERRECSLSINESNEVYTEKYVAI